MRQARHAFAARRTVFDAAWLSGIEAVTDAGSPPLAAGAAWCDREAPRLKRMTLDRKDKPAQ
jgi:hypothetical protein